MKTILDTKFDELKKRGADCPADLTYDVLLVELRHTFLASARDLIVNNPQDKAMGEMCCAVAEHMQAAIDVWGFDPATIEDLL